MNFITEEEIDRVLGRISSSKKGPKVKGEILEYFTDTKSLNKQQKTTTIQSTPYTAETYQGFKEDIKTKQPHTRIHRPYVEKEFTRKIQRPLNKTLITRTLTKTRVNTTITKKPSLIAKMYAMLVDMSIVALAQSFILFTAYKLLGRKAFYSALHINGIGISSAIQLGAIMFVAYTSILAFYLIFFEALSGQTIGKNIMGIKVIDKTTNSKPSITTGIFRVLLFFVTFPLSLFGIHSYLSGTTLQRVSK